MASLLLSLSLLLSAQAQLDSCPVPEVVVDGRSITKVGGWVDLAKVLRPDIAASTEAEGISAACSGQHPCNAATQILCTGQYALHTCYARAPDGPWYAFAASYYEHSSDSAYDVELTAAASRDGRYLIASIFLSPMQRAGDRTCHGDDDRVCGSEWSAYGAESRQFVLDTTTLRLLFWSRTGEIVGNDDEGGYSCPDSGLDVARSDAGDVFTRTNCLGEVERFELNDLAFCTEAAHDAAHGRAFDAFDTKATELVAAGRRHTRERSFDEAIAAFTQVLHFRADHPTALSGRGYARLLRASGNDLVDARADFKAALAAAPADDKKFRAAVMFNLGLVAEKLGEPNTHSIHALPPASPAVAP